MTRALRLTPDEHAALQTRAYGPPEPPLREIPRLLESDIIGPVLKALLTHPKVAFAWRANSGKFDVVDLYGERTLIVNFKGCSDILFMLKGGRFGACEVKAKGKEPRVDQQSFLDNVSEAGGLAFVARSVDDVYAAVPL